MDCYKEYLENAGGQLQGQNPPAYTRGLLKAKQVFQPPTTQGFNDFDSGWRKRVFGGCFGDCAICHIVLFGANSANTAWQFFWAPQHIIVLLNVLEGSQPTIAIAIPDSKPLQTH